MTILPYEETPLVPPPHSDLAAMLDAARMEWLADYRTAHSGGAA